MVSVGDRPSEVVIRVLKSLQLSGEVFGLFSGGIAVELADGGPSFERLDVGDQVMLTHTRTPTGSLI